MRFSLRCGALPSLSLDVDRIERALHALLKFADAHGVLGSQVEVDRDGA